MANEVRVLAGLQINFGNLKYTSPVQSFLADLTGAAGPTPGAINVTTAGVDIDLSALTTPGWAFFYNNDSENYVEIGVHDGTLFHAYQEVGPGEGAVLKFSRNLFEERTIPGTGTTGDVNTLHAIANGATVNLLVAAFEA